jgi:hypothetical protein
MIQRREDFGFTVKPREAIRIAGYRLGQHFDSHRPLQVGVSSAVYLAHPTSTNAGGDLIRADASADSQRHVEPARLYEVVAVQCEYSKVTTIWRPILRRSQ